MGSQSAVQRPAVLNGVMFSLPDVMCVEFVPSCISELFCSDSPSYLLSLQSPLARSTTTTNVESGANKLLFKKYTDQPPCSDHSPALPGSAYMVLAITHRLEERSRSFKFLLNSSANWFASSYPDTKPGSDFTKGAAPDPPPGSGSLRKAHELPTSAPRAVKTSSSIRIILAKRQNYSRHC